MSVPELSIQIKNIPGQMVKITTILAEAGVNIRGIAASSAGKFGWVRIIVDKTKEAEEALTDYGFAVETGEAVGVLLMDEPGTLDRALRVLADEKLNLDFIYTCLERDGDRVMAILGVQTPGKVERLFAKHHLKVVDFGA